MPTFGLDSREIQPSQTQPGFGMVSNHLDWNYDGEEEEYSVAKSCLLYHKVSLKSGSDGRNKDAVLVRKDLPLING